MVMSMSLAASSSSTSAVKPQRILACVLCQQRKVKCDRKFPCSNCIKARVQCQPAQSTTRRQRRQIPESKELLERLRQYEDLLKANNIAFDHLKSRSICETGQRRDEVSGTATEHAGTNYPSPATTIKMEQDFERKDLWHAIHRAYRHPSVDSDSSGEEITTGHVLQRVLADLFQDTNHLLFGLGQANYDVLDMHPDPVDIFRLWQIYVDNVNPLLKVTHIPSLQADIIAIVGNLESINNPLQALLFAIYCLAVLSIDDVKCQAMFGASKQELLSKYQDACQLALQNCGILQTDDRTSLTAFYLYLISITWLVHPRSLTSMLAIAIRLAQRMGIQNESDNLKFSPFEAEMRRRLWWSLVMFDTRIGHLGKFTNGPLNPTWDAKIPLNVHDSDLRQDMQAPAESQLLPSDAIFAVVRSEIGDHSRNSKSYLNFTTPALKPLAGNTEAGSVPSTDNHDDLERRIEDKYLKICDPSNPVHFMTIGMARIELARVSLVGNTSSYDKPEAIEPDVWVTVAIKMLEADTKLSSSPLSAGFKWYTGVYFPLPAYILLTKDLKRRPNSERAWEAWEAMGDNIKARVNDELKIEGLLLDMVCHLTLDAWQARKLAARTSGFSWPTPTIIAFFSTRAAQQVAKFVPGFESDLDLGELLASESEVQEESVNITAFEDMAMPIQLDASNDLLYGMSGFDDYSSISFPILESNVEQLDWEAMNL